LIPHASPKAYSRQRPSPRLHRPAARYAYETLARRRCLVHEIKLDGYRTAARIERGQVAMFTRAGNDWTARFRPIAAILATLKTRAAYLDGEIVVVTGAGISDFGALQESLGRHGGSAELVYVAFDILHLDGRDLRPLPLPDGLRTSAQRCR
jgi:bifunctional non-homologous end joining protein LigD